MKRIIINENDLTFQNLDAAEITDVAYIPGFSLANCDDDDSTAVKPHVPTLCKTTAEFVRFFGPDVPVFNEDQAYPTKFHSDAIPQGISMFRVGDADPSYMMAYELLSQGIPVWYERVNDKSGRPFILDDETGEEILNPDYEVTVAKMYEELAKIFSFKDGNKDTVPEICEIGWYNIKYITSGGYPVFEYDSNSIAKDMIKCAETRGDAIGFIDHTNNSERTLDASNTKSVYNKIQAAEFNSSYAAMLTPWCDYALNNTYKFSQKSPEYAQSYSRAVLPGSFGYMISLAKSIVNNPNWLAIAGVSRGLVPNLKTVCTAENLTNTVAESYVTDLMVVEKAGFNYSINPITNIKPYGYCIWGNRTLKKDNGDGMEIATHYLNTRNMICDIKKQVYIAAKRLMFEQNTDILWVNFKSLILPMLDQMKSGYAIKGYKTIRNDSEDRSKVSATIVIYPIASVEKFEINIVLQNEEVEIEG